MKNPTIFKGTLLIFSCVLLTVLGLAILNSDLNADATTTIGLDINTGNITSSGTITSQDLTVQKEGDATLTVYSNTNGPTADSKLLVVQKGTDPLELFSVDEDGDVAIANDLAVTGNVTAGTWQGAPIATKYGGTGQDWSAAAQGNLPFFSAEGTLDTLTPGTTGQFLSQGSDGNPAWANVARSATFVVAASNSSDLSKQQANYVCDGTDDQEQIQTAINALPSGGGKVLLMEGNYLISDTIELNSNVTFQGSGWNTIIKAKDAFGLKHILNASGKSFIHILDLQIDGNFANNPKAGDYDDQNGIELYNSDDCIVENCYVHDTPDDGIAVDHGSDNNTISNNKVKGTHWHSIMIWWDSHGNTVLGNHCLDAGNIVIEKAGSVDSDRNIISNNIIENSWEQGIHILDSSYVTVTSNTIIVNNTSEDGIEVTVADPLTDHTVEGIIISNNEIFSGVAGINVYVAGNSNNIFTNSSFIGNMMYNGISYGIRLDGIAGTHISYIACIGNTIIGCSGGFHTPVPNLDHVTVIGNQIVNSTHNAFNAWKGTNNIISLNNTVGDFDGDYSGTIMYNKHSDLLMNVLAASADAVHAAITGNGTSQEITTGITNPDVARNISITNSANSTGDVTIEGIDAKGNSVSEAITIATGGTAYGDVAFATVTKITIPGTVANPATISVGFSDKLGLSNIIYETGDVYKVKKNTADAAIGTVDTTYGTVDCSTITGDDDFTIWYKSNLNVIN